MKSKLIIFAVCIAMGCTTLTQQDNNVYPAEVVENIINSCNKDGKDKNFCVCLSRKMQKKYKYSEFEVIDKAIADGNPPEEFTKFSLEAGHQCAANAPKNKSGYPAKVIKNFVSGCERSGSDTKSCVCFSKKIQERYAYEEFVKIEKRIAEGDPPGGFVRIVEEFKQGCAEKSEK